MHDYDDSCEVLIAYKIRIKIIIKGNHPCHSENCSSLILVVDFSIGAFLFLSLHKHDTQTNNANETKIKSKLRMMAIIMKILV